MTKKFKVGFYYTEYGTSIVKANNKLDAESKLYKRLSDNGLDNLVYDCNDREYDTQDAEEV